VKISDLIAKLQREAQQFGDVDVMIESFELSAKTGQPYQEIDHVRNLVMRDAVVISLSV